MKHKTRTKALSWLLSLALMLSLLPGMSLTALAWDGDPYAELLNTTTAVNFDGKEWYLIENNSTAANAGTVTLLSKECVAASQYNSSSESYVEYASSTVKTAVDNYYTNSISSDVKTAIVDNKMFLLTKEQANAMTTDTRKCSQASGASSNDWWLCSPGDKDTHAACVDGDDGDVFDEGGSVNDYTLGVRPALKLNLESVIFSSESKTFAVGSATVAVTGVSLDKTTAHTIEVDGKVSFTATVAPDNATDKKVKWSVGGTNAGAVKLYSDEACTTEVGTDATETLTVYAKGISAGNATVTATSNADTTKTASCDVRVSEAQPSSYTLTIPSTLSVANSGWNATAGISATGYLADGKKLTVTASSGGEFALVNQSDSTQKVGYKLATASTDTAATTSWEFTELSSTATKKDMGIIVEDYSTKPAGTYTDIVTFTASVEDAAPKTLTLTGEYTNMYGTSQTKTITIEYTDNDTWKDIADRYNEVSIQNNTYSPDGKEIRFWYESTFVPGCRLKSNQSTYSYNIVNVNDKVSAYSSYSLEST